MKKFLVFFTSIMIIVSYVSCQRQPTEFHKGGLIMLNLRFAEQPEGESRVGSLSKAAETSGIVNDQVLLLHCNEDSGFRALDASAYGNDMLLYNVGWDSSATPQLGRALRLDGVHSYALSEFYGNEHAELNGTYGLEISMYFYALGKELYYEKRLLDRMDYNGGYTLGIANDHLFFRVRQGMQEFSVTSGTAMALRTWYKVTARFSDGKLALLINDTPTGKSVDFTGPITPSFRQMVIGAGWAATSGIPTFHFNGRIDEVSIRSAVEYVDFDRIRVAVIDLSDFNENQFHYSPQWLNYHQSFHAFIEDTANVLTWERWKKMWRDAGLTIFTEETLTISGAFAEGTVRGTDGLNLLAVAGMRSAEVIYYGIGYALVMPGQIAQADVDLWPTPRGTTP